MVKIPDVDVLGKLGVQNRDERGLIQVMPSTERYFGEELRKTAPKGVGAFLMSQSQQLSMEVSLGTSIFAQFASVLRTLNPALRVSHCVHAALRSHDCYVSPDGGPRSVILPQDIVWPAWVQVRTLKVMAFTFPSCQSSDDHLRMDRTHSIMRIATTASPVSGADVRDRMVELHLRFKVEKAVNLVIRHFNRWKAAKIKKELDELRSSMISPSRTASLDNVDGGSLKSEWFA